MAARPRPGRKILIASIGVATLNYVGVSCGSTERGSAFDAGPGAETSVDTAIDQFEVVGNFVAPAPNDATSDATADVVDDATSDVVDDIVVFPADAIDDLPVANLVALPPMDSGPEGG
jgi:hypothetical protein